VNAPTRIALATAHKVLALSPMGRLALSLRPSDPHKGLYVVFTGYYDESGTHGGSPFTILAGFVGNAEHWARFEGEWRKVLRKYGLTHLHAKHLFHRQKQHKGWKPQQIRRLMADILYVIQERLDPHRDLFFATKTKLNENDYIKSYIENGPLKGERLDSRYAVCFRAFLDFNLIWVKGRELSDIPLNFVLEAGHCNAGDALRVFNETKADKRVAHRHLIGSIAFGDKKEFPALQAADMLAYLFHSTERDRLENVPLFEQEKGPFYDPDDWFMASDFEEELMEIGIPILEHVITPQHLMTLRQNFLARRAWRSNLQFKIS
jgi:hypothetical protein